MLPDAQEAAGVDEPFNFDSIVGFTIMLCEETKPLISQYVDDAVSLPLRVTIDEHLDQCPICRSHLAELKLIKQNLRNLLITGELLQRKSNSFQTLCARQRTLIETIENCLDCCLRRTNRE